MIQSLIQIGKPLRSYDSIREWSDFFFSKASYQSPIEQAIWGGYSCQQFSFAFLAGYQAALEKLFPSIASNELKALCITEEGGGQAIKTSLVNNQINGSKSYLTAGSDAAHLFVLCNTNEVKAGRALLKMVHLPNNSAGMEITNFELPFMHEVKHGKLLLKEVGIESAQILPGDGFIDYAKPFRSLEDIHVATAYQAMLLRQAMDYQWEENIRDQLILSLYTLKNLSTLPPNDKETHLLIAANEHQFEQLLPDIEANIESKSPTHFKKDWDVNKKVTTIAKKVKALRLTKARATLFS